MGITRIWGNQPPLSVACHPGVTAHITTVQPATATPAPCRLALALGLCPSVCPSTPSFSMHQVPIQCRPWARLQAYRAVVCNQCEPYG